MTMSNMKTLEAPKTKIDRVARTFRPILASAEGDNLPTRIELLKSGLWDTPNHGVFVVTSEDLAQYKENFDAGVAQAGNSGIMIDYDHQKGIAAGWIKGLDIGLDANGVETLYADPVEWTGAGKKDLLEKNYKCISPEFFPASRGGWEDPERYGVYIPNVLAAAGLVNRPLFKGLTPIMASADSDKTEVEDKNVIFISASEKEKSMPTLEEVRAKDASALTEEDKSFLVEHKAELTAEEQAKFGFEVTAETAEQVKEREDKEAQAKLDQEAEDKRIADEAAAARETAPDLTNATPVMASAVKGDEGKVVMAASEVKELYEIKAGQAKKEAEEIVKSHVARGAIVASEAGATVDMLMTAGANRANLEAHLNKLPANPVLAGENGSSEKAGEVLTATAQIKTKAEAIMASAKAEGKTLDIGTAMGQVMQAEPELAKQYQNERVGKE